MDVNHIARLGLARLRLPVPTGKMIVVHSMAEALKDTEVSEVWWDVLKKWLSELEFESEVLEALTIPMLAKEAAIISATELRGAINRPSILSDKYLGDISGSKILFNSWANAHSGEAPALYSLDNLLTELENAQTTPPILSNKLKSLERKFGFPFRKQWAYEFDRLINRHGKQYNGHWEYFIGDDEREQATGQFITRKSHLARSAYLRTFALACDAWDMPEESAMDAALYAAPIDPVFLRMLPGSAPAWIESVASFSPDTQEDWQKWIYEMIEKSAEDADYPEILYLNMPFENTKTYKAEIELISCLISADTPEPAEAFGVHHFLPGRSELPRTEDIKIVIPQYETNDPFPCKNGSDLLPALIPANIFHIGYFHSDLLHRLPYLPVNYSSSSNLHATPEIGGLNITRDEKTVAKVKYWNWRWSPTHHRDLGSQCGTALITTHDYCQNMMNIPGMTVFRFWRATVFIRDKEYGDWEKKEFSGVVP